MWRLTAPMLCMATLVSSNVLSSNYLSVRQESVERRPLSTIGYLRPGSFFGGVAPERESEADQLFETAGRQPNETSSVSFDFAPGNLSESADTTWTWLLNVTDLAVPEDIISGGLRVVNLQWSLQWPGGGNLRTSMNSWDIPDDEELCFTTVDFILPSNITSRYSEAEPGSCSEILGTECANRLQRQTLHRPDGRCGAISSDFDECSDTLGLGSGGSLGIARFGQVNSSDTFYYETSQAVPADELTEWYTQAVTSLRVLLVQGQESESRLLCQIIDPAASGGAASRRLDGYMIWVSVLVMVWGFVSL